jgi:hypothetical protein
MPDDNTPDTSTETKTSFSLEYVQELRGESAAYRTKAKEAETKAQAAEAKALEAQQAADARIAAASQAANDRIIRAELKAEAAKAGLVDADALKLADLSQVSVNDQGDVVGAADLMKALKLAKPYLFGSVATTSQIAPPPGKIDTKPFNAKHATPEELAADAKARGLNIKLY